MQKVLFNMERLRSAQMGGWVGERLNANLAHWIRDVPEANPAMFQTLINRDMPNLGFVHGGEHEYIGKYLTGAAYCLQLSGDGPLREAIEATVARMAQAQAPSGYLGGMPAGDQFVREHAKAGEKKYLWDVWGHYHAMLGLVIVYRITGNQLALTVALKAARNILRYFSDKALSYVRCGFTNLAIGHVFALLYEQTGQEAFLQFAKRAVDALHDPESEAGDYLEGALAGKEFYELPNTRWEGLHAIEAFAILWRITGETRYKEAFQRIWYSIARSDRHNTGGFTSDERAVGNPYDLRGIETCCSVAWTVLSTHMLQMTHESAIADEIELSTYNAIFAAQHPSGRHSTYNTPMIGDKKASIHEIVFQAIAGAPETNCCSVNLSRGLAGMAEWGFIAQDKDFYLNYYGECEAEIELPDGSLLKLTQHTRYPVEGKIDLHIAGLGEHTLYLRIPCWSKHSFVRIGGGERIAVPAGKYFAVQGSHAGELTVCLELDMSIHCWHGERVVKGKAALYHGPLLLAYDYRFNGTIARPFRPIDVTGTPTPTFSKEIRFAFSDAPTIPFQKGKWARVSCDTKPRPWLLYRLEDTFGKPVFLCDFVTAGQTGTPYTTWLPLDAYHALPMARGQKPWDIWCAEVPD